MGGCQRSALPCPFGLAGVENFRRLCGSEPCPEACHTAHGEGRPPLQVGTGVPSVGLGGFRPVWRAERRGPCGVAEKSGAGGCAPSLGQTPVGRQSGCDGPVSSSSRSVSQEHSGRVFRLQFDEFQIISSSHDDTILIWDFLNVPPSAQNETRSPSRTYTYISR